MRVPSGDGSAGEWGLASAGSYTEQSGSALIYDETSGQGTLPTVSEFKTLMGLWPAALLAPRVPDTAVRHACGKMYRCNYARVAHPPGTV